MESWLDKVILISLPVFATVIYSKLLKNPFNDSSGLLNKRLLDNTGHRPEFRQVAISSAACPQGQRHVQETTFRDVISIDVPRVGRRSSAVIKGPDEASGKPSGGLLCLNHRALKASEPADENIFSTSSRLNFWYQAGWLPTFNTYFHRILAQMLRVHGGSIISNSSLLSISQGMKIYLYFLN